METDSSSNPNFFSSSQAFFCSPSSGHSFHSSPPLLLDLMPPLPRHASCVRSSSDSLFFPTCASLVLEFHHSRFSLSPSLLFCSLFNSSIDCIDKEMVRTRSRFPALAIWIFQRIRIYWIHIFSVLLRLLTCFVVPLNFLWHPSVFVQKNKSLKPSVGRLVATTLRTFDFLSASSACAVSFALQSPLRDELLVV